MRTVNAQRFAYLCVAAPPIFTLLGVLLYMIKINGSDVQVWMGTWTASAIFMATLQLTWRCDDARGRAEVAFVNVATYRSVSVLRMMHGLTALVLTFVFLAPR